LKVYNEISKLSDCSFAVLLTHTLSVVNVKQTFTKIIHNDRLRIIFTTLR